MDNRLELNRGCGRSRVQFDGRAFPSRLSSRGERPVVCAILKCCGAMAGRRASDGWQGTTSSGRLSPGKTDITPYTIGHCARKNWQGTPNWATDKVRDLFVKTASRGRSAAASLSPTGWLASILCGKPHRPQHIFGRFATPAPHAAGQRVLCPFGAAIMLTNAGSAACRLVFATGHVLGVRYEAASLA